MKTGLDVWVEQGFAALKGKRVGAIVNPTSVDSRFRHLADLLAQTPGVKLAALFGPEHGIRGEAQYMVAVGEARDRRTGVPVHSLYGSTFESLSPTAEWLPGLDALVFDIQDVGSRYYTYVYTMALAMKAAAQAKVPFYVLDRPNPLGGTLVEGNLVGERYRSFVGLYPLPNRHGMTAGELARLFNAEQGLGCELTVVPCEGWRRDDVLVRHRAALHPALAEHAHAGHRARLPGHVPGRGHQRLRGPRHLPSLRAVRRALGGLRTRWWPGSAQGAPAGGHASAPVGFTPTFDKYKGESCSGAFIHVTDRAGLPAAAHGHRHLPGRARAGRAASSPGARTPTSSSRTCPPLTCSAAPTRCAGAWRRAGPWTG